MALALAGPAITRTIVYTYDKLYHLTNANYTTGETYSYTYDPVGNRKSQTALAQTTVYTYDAANRLTNAGPQAYTWSANSNLLSTGVSTNTFDVANRLTQSQRATTTLQVAYNGLNDRVSQTVGVTTTTSP
jgi:YD repeat-containing protein